MGVKAWEASRSRTASSLSPAPSLRQALAIWVSIVLGEVPSRREMALLR